MLKFNDIIIIQKSSTFTLRKMYVSLDASFSFYDDNKFTDRRRTRVQTRINLHETVHDVRLS